MPEPHPAPVSCEEKRELIEAACAALERIQLLTEQHTERGRLGMSTIEEVEQFSDDFERAIRFHQSLLEEYDSHVRQHGC